MLDLPHTPALLAFVLEHRFCTVDQLRWRFAGDVTARSTMYYQVRKLVERGYLARIPIRAVLPTHPEVLITTGKAHTYLASAYEAVTGVASGDLEGEQRRAERGYGLLFVQHELAITSLDVALFHHTRQRPDVQLMSTERRYHLGENRIDAGIIPDAGYHVGHARNGHRWFEWLLLEYDRGTMAPGRVGEKLKSYGRWAESASGQHYLEQLYQRFGDLQTVQPSFRLLVVARARRGEGSDERRLVKLLAEAALLPPPMRRRVWFATAADLEQCAHDLGSRVWVSGRHLSAAVPEAEEMNLQVRRRWIAKNLSSLPRLALFPPSGGGPIAPSDGGQGGQLAATRMMRDD